MSKRFLAPGVYLLPLRSGPVLRINLGAWLFGYRFNVNSANLTRVRDVIVAALDQLQAELSGRADDNPPTNGEPK